MPSPTVAARRFYRAFYYWTTLSHAPGRCRVSTRRYGLRTSTRACNEEAEQGDIFPGSHSRRRVIGEGAHEPNTVSSSGIENRLRTRQQAFTSSRDWYKLPKQWRESSVLSAVERPSNVLKNGEVVVRHRSNASLMIELALEQDVLKAGQQVYGVDFEVLARRHEVKVDIQCPQTNTEAKEPCQKETHLYYILISGTYMGVLRMYNAVGNARKRLATQQYNSASGREIQELDQSVGPPPNVPNVWLRQPIQSEAQRPSNTLNPPELAVRERSQHFIKLDIAIPESRSDKLLNYNVPLQQGTDTHFKIHSFSKKSKAVTNSSTEPSNHVLTLSGSYSNVLKIFNDLGLVAPRWNLTFISPATQSSVSSKTLAIESVSFKDESPKTVQRAANVANIPWKFHIRIEGSSVTPIVDYVVGGQYEEMMKLKYESGCYEVYQIGNGIIGRGPHSSVRAIVASIKQRIIQAAETIRCEITVTYSFTPHTRSKPQPNFEPTQMVDGNSHNSLQGDLASEEAMQLGEDVRVALRGLTHPVVLITSREIDAKDSPLHGAQLLHSRGITVSSFNTVTLQPQPIISFNIKTPSRTWDAIRSSGCLRVHFLHANEKGAAIAAVFTKPYDSAHAGFRYLEDMGAKISTYPGRIAPHIYFKDGVVAHLSASLLPDQCVEVSDHIIVVAKVNSIKFADETGLKDAAELGRDHLAAISALSYARQSYRGFGPSIEAPQRPEEVVSPQQSSEGRKDVRIDHKSKGLASESKVRRETPISPRFIDEPTNDPIYNILRGSRDAARENYSIDIDKLWNEANEDVGRITHEEDEGDDLYCDQTQHNDTLDLPITSDKDHSSIGSEVGIPLWSPDELAREESGRLGSQRKAESSFNLSALENEGGSSSNSIAKPFGVRSSSLLGQGALNKRLYSTVSIMSKSSHDSRTSMSTTPHPQNPTEQSIDITRVVERDALKTNVADYLGVPDNNAPSKSNHVRSLIKLNHAARLAEKRLGEEKDQLSKDEILQLRNEIRSNDRTVTRKLAWNAAGDLRLMLDKGRVDFKRATFLENMIEKGQALLLEDAKHARQLLESGTIDTDQFQSLKLRLESDHATLITETNRLRQFVDEEAEDYKDE